MIGLSVRARSIFTQQQKRLTKNVTEEQEQEARTDAGCVEPGR